MKIFLLCVIMMLGSRAYSAQTVEELTIVLHKTETFRDNLIAAYNTGKDPAPVEFPSGTIRNIDRSVLPHYIKSMEYKIEKLNIKIKQLP